MLKRFGNVDDHDVSLAMPGQLSLGAEHFDGRAAFHFEQGRAKRFCGPNKGRKLFRMTDISKLSQEAKNA